MAGRETPVDFAALIAELRGEPYRMSLRSIAEAINVPPSTLRKWYYEGSPPRYDDGQALVTLHQQLTTKGRGS